MGETVTEEQVLAMIAEITRLRGDDESQHSIEDDMRKKVLRAIAAGIDPETARRLAKLALSTEDLHFARWCA